MITTLIILLGLAIGVLASLFYFANKRLGKLIEDCSSINHSLDILNDNQRVLEKDLKRLFHEFQNNKKENNHRR